MANLTLAGRHWKEKAVNRLRRRMPDAREDVLNALIVDALADLALAARAEGFTWAQIENGAQLGLSHGRDDEHEGRKPNEGGS